MTWKVHKGYTIVLKIVSEHRSSRWKGVNGWYSTGFGFVSHQKQVAPVLTWVM